MGIVRFALRYQHTFYVLALLMVFLGGSAIIATPKDIFPSINIPVVTVIWQYTGLTPEEMDQRVTTYSEYAISTSVSNIRNIESQTLSGISVEKIFFQPNVNVDLAISQIVSATNFIRALMPAGIQPPVIVQFNASSVPVLQLSLSSDRLNEQQLYDYGIYQMRQALAPIPGITLPTPYGGKYRQIMVDLDPDALRAHGITPNDVRQRRQRAEPDTAVRRRQDSATSSSSSKSTHSPIRSPRSTGCRSSRSAAPPSISPMSRMCATAGPCSRTSCAPKASARCC